MSRAGGGGGGALFIVYMHTQQSACGLRNHSLKPTLLKKKGPRGVRFEGCYSPGSVMATHKGVELTSWGVGRLR